MKYFLKYVEGLLLLIEELFFCFQYEISDR